MTNASVKFILDGKAMLNGDHTVYISVIINRKRKNISLGLKCKIKHFENEQFNKLHKAYKADNLLLTSVKSKANKIIREFQLDNKNFDVNDFEIQFRGNQIVHKELKVIDFYIEIIDEMKRGGNISNANAYLSTKNSLIKFQNNKIKFSDITLSFLEKYEVYLRENNNQNGGISFKMRGLKALYNKARKRDLIPKGPHPFEYYQVAKLKSNVSKRALSIEDFKKIKNFDLTKNPFLVDTYLFFIFSTYTRGMNFTDMATLKWSDIRNNRIHYTRSKTKGKFNIEIIENVQKILDFYKSQNRQTQYVFPILLNDNLSLMQIYYRKQKVLSLYNSKLKEIAAIVGIETKLTSYVARHSFATILKMKGTAIEKIMLRPIRDATFLET
jgi:integrase